MVVSSACRVTISAAVVLWVGLLGGCGHGQPEAAIPARVLASTYPDRPFLLIYRTPTYPGPNDPIVSGVEFAIWKDGRFLRPTSFKDLQKPYLQGQLNQDEMQELLVRLEGVRGRMEHARKQAEAIDFGARYVVFRTARKTITLLESATPEPTIAEVRQIVAALPAQQLEPMDFDGTVAESWKTP